MASEYTDTDGFIDRLLSILLAFGTALGLAAAGFFVANLLSLPLVAVFALLDISLQSTVGYAASTLLQGAAFVGVVVAYMYYADHPGLLDIRWPSLSKRTLRDAGWIVTGFVVLLITSQAVGLALQEFGLAPGTNRIVSAVRADPTLALYLIVLSFVATGPGEETLFRGGVQGVLRRVFSPVPAVVLSSALFGLAHATTLVAASGASGVWGYILSTFLLGLVLGGLYEYTTNLVIPALVHGAYNAILFVQLYLTQTTALGLSGF